MQRNVYDDFTYLFCVYLDFQKIFDFKLYLNIFYQIKVISL